MTGGIDTVRNDGKGRMVLSNLTQKEKAGGYRISNSRTIHAQTYGLMDRNRRERMKHIIEQPDKNIRDPLFEWR